MRHLVFLVFDSARYDAVLRARTPNIRAIGPVERRWSYASWTLPSHVALLTGLLPHRNKPGTLASATYRADLLQWERRLGVNGGPPIRFEQFVPHLSLPRFLAQLGYRCEAFVSLPVLNPDTLVARHFHKYTLMPRHNDLGAIIDHFRFDGSPRFYFVNTGETHYPYLLPGETAADLPRLPGVHGTFRALDDFLADPSRVTDEDGAIPFTTEQLAGLRDKQVRCLEHLDRVVGDLLAVAPANTYFIITSDHGELFGEGGYFGHGPIVHEKVFEVFLVEGLHPGGGDAACLAGGAVGEGDPDNTDERVVLDRLRTLGYL